MNEYILYKDFADGIFRRLKEDINGYLSYEVFPDVGVIVFNIKFKTFTYSYAVSDVMTHINNGDSGRIAEDFKTSYKKEILKAFFKSEYAKKRKNTT